MIRRPPRSTLFPTRRSSDLESDLHHVDDLHVRRIVAAGFLQRRCPRALEDQLAGERIALDRKSTRLNSSHGYISYAVFCLKKKKKIKHVRSRNYFVDCGYSS